MSSTATTLSNQSDNIIGTFADIQLENVRHKTIRESTLLELLTCAFFCGAQKQLCKQAQVSDKDGRVALAGLLMDINGIAQSNAIGLIDSIDRLADKYYLVENTAQQGKVAADQWLNCDDDPANELQDLISKYKNLSMFELGIEGVNETYIAQQQELYSKIDQSVSRLRKRAFFFLLILFEAGIVAAIALYFM